MFFGTVGFAQLKVVAPNGDVKIGDTGVAPLGKLTIQENNSKVTIHESPTSGSERIDITGGLTGSIRMGSINYDTNNFGGAVLQTWADASTYKGSFFFDTGFSSGAAINFRTSFVTKMRIISNGNVGIGINSPTEALDVVGNIKATGTITPSDKRLKRNINQFQMGLEEVLQIQPVSFTYNGKGGTKDGSDHIGLIAQELQKIAPSLVKEYEHKNIAEATTEENYKLISSENYLSIKDSEIKYLLINAIKEQQEIIQIKSEEISILEDKLVLLENKINSLIKSSGSTIDVDVNNKEYMLQNKPNPFSEDTTIAYSIPSDSRNAKLEIHDMTGKKLKSISLDEKNGEVKINSFNLPSGTYTYSLVINNRLIESKKMIYVK